MDTQEVLVKGRKIRFRRNEKKDDARIEALIRYCLIEYDGAKEGTAWCDPYLGRFSEVYAADGSAYWVAVDEDDRVLCGTGIGPVEGVPGVCELQKMYAYPELRGTGIAQKLLEIALGFARERYERCYIETLGNMYRAQAFYERNGFYRIDDYIGNTGHHSCEVKMIKDLK